MATWYQRILRRLGLDKSLALHLAEACDSVQGLRKTGHNDDLDFPYLKILDLANQLRAELLPRGIVLIPNDVECIQETFTTPEGGHVTEVRVRTEFEVTDGRRKLVKAAYGSARDGNGFAVSIAQTMALKSWLKRLGMIFGEEDDSEQTRWGAWPGEKKAMQNYQQRALSAALKSCNLTREGAETLLSKVMGFPITFEGIADLPRKDFDVAMKALTKHEDITAVLEMSKRKVEEKRAQSVVAIMDKPAHDEIA